MDVDRSACIRKPAVINLCDVETATTTTMPPAQQGPTRRVFQRRQPLTNMATLCLLFYLL